MSQRTIGIIFNIAALLCTLIWLLLDSGWEPLATTIGLLGTLIRLLYSRKGDDDAIIIMKQKGGKNSNNYQSKGDINIKLKK